MNQSGDPRNTAAGQFSLRDTPLKPASRPSIAEAIDEANKMLNELHLDIQNLEERLYPALTQEPAKGMGGSEKDAVRSEPANYVQRISLVSGSIVAATAKLRYIMSRLEI